MLVRFTFVAAALYCGTCCLVERLRKCKNYQIGTISQIHALTMAAVSPTSLTDVA